MTTSGINLYFYDARFRMNQSERILVRLLSGLFFSISIAICIIFLLSDIKWIFWSGILLFIVLIDYINHFGQAEKSLQQKKLKGDINLAKYSTSSVLTALEYAFERSLIFGSNFYLFLLKHLISRKDIKNGLYRMGLKPLEVVNKVDDSLRKNLKDKKFPGSRQEHKKYLLEQIEKIMIFSLEQAFRVHNRFIEPKDLFAALSHCEDPEVLRILEFFNIEVGDLENVLIFSRYPSFFRWSRFLPRNLGGFTHAPFKIRHRVMNRAWSARPTPVLDCYSEDLTDYARTGSIGFLIGHRNEYDRMVDILSRPGKPNVLLIGEPGVGKESTVAHLAFRIIKDEVPPELFDKRLVMLKISSLVAGAEPSELQERFKKIIDEIISAGNIILYIPDIHNLSKSFTKGSFNALDALLPVISSSAFSVIGATYPKEYRQSIEPQTDFAHAFEKVAVEEISSQEAIQLLVYDAIILERQFRVFITFNAIKQAVLLASKYFRDKLLPSSAQELLREALSNVKDRKDKTLDADNVIDTAQRRINIPLRQAKETEAQKLLNLESIIHERLIDQEEAVSAVARALREYRSGMARKGGPIAVFLFVGPTGVGKTELSKILTNIQFGSEKAMIRFDMSEYQDKQSIFRFIGSPDGNIDGNLTGAVSQKPYSLVLLDEFEKAHPDILNLFLQVFDDGRLTDNLGRVVDFQNTIIIATSNAHSDLIKSEIEGGKTMTEIGDELKKKLVEYFRPELINRFSGVIVFKNLSTDDIIAISRILLKDLIDELKKNQGIELNFEPEAVKKIAEWGYDPVFGARPLRGVISEKIRSVLAEKILKNEITKGNKVTIELENNELKYNVDKI